jgi:hypothetical protein
VSAEFIQLVSSEANEVAAHEKKATIGPEHVIKALKDLDFEEFIADVSETWESFKEESKGERTPKNMLRLA